MRLYQFSLLFVVSILIWIYLRNQDTFDFHEEETETFGTRYLENRNNKSRDPYYTNQDFHEETETFGKRYLDNRNTTECKPKPVIIVTYGRSGSTFLGNLLRLNKDVFYIFEPLHFLSVGYKRLHYLNGKTRSFDSYLTAAEFVIRNMLSCQLLSIPMEYWTGTFNTTNIQGHQLCSFQTLYATEQKKRYSAPDKFRAVLKILQKQCQNSTSVIIKTIRTPLFLLKNLLHARNKLKVIHLVRDPRPTVESQKTVIYGDYSTFTSFRDHARNFCSRVFNDVTTFDIFRIYYPRQLRRLLLEDLAMEPFDVVSSLFEFMNISFSRDLETKIHTMTTANKSVRHVVANTVGNSRKLVSKWRLETKISFVQEVDRQCNFLYSRLGYISVTSAEMLKNLSISLYSISKSEKPFKFGLEIPKLS